MKTFSSFIFLNALILFAYAQDQTLPATTCEQSFALQGTTCTPCQQAIFKNGGSDDASSFINKKPPSNKCLFTSIFTYHLLESSSATPATPSTPGTPGTPKIDSAIVKDALDKTCADTANNACSESDAKNAYTEIDKACDAELNQYLSSEGTPGTGKGPAPTSANMVGPKAESLMLSFYLAIPIRDISCLKVNGEYCSVKEFEQAKQAQSQSPNTNPFANLQCDECSKQSYGNIKGYLSSHPPDTPNLQKIVGDTQQSLQAFENQCPNIASSAKSDGQKLANQFYNYFGIILISLVGFIYTTVM
ncbi:hypothetical protein RhiirA1_532277 [Rhizophagus irregularis]|uniref:Uncharacterized protein n=3 Tax=Rhizophagus irregularis TaxID=588596 RepID=A0A2N0S631_9GLOM|nr:hypothetical protein GLOIN_2v1727228 [Rhizophagus irregularis DAOM 181602=DAOM 197198]EXX68906.1 hypothetical protein RirG_100750 [Rhizophagus irregularis DAOM 197198w]PKC71003.1 hypothetical protein RhiirA1_532277 [Rhizophagus irregularis]POG58826.1 hypothetical protein GLOIN_2v1727228 [Rhizophagus irregularis DAOM 181602=DAOM 197198]UZO26699.1 hypothetical protein OCT59_018913 [Rhizophagus irregularis]CAB4487996.1 unnamed protein product [Rhizophagus irregularis]|eukprot:XP_025165692.1 hypothetical protein GLOIN_2v1727228 [Rhizophagus irregularis DAOM 181602=DAOM 197198]